MNVGCCLRTTVCYLMSPLSTCLSIRREWAPILCLSLSLSLILSSSSSLEYVCVCVCVCVCSCVCVFVCVCMCVCLCVFAYLCACLFRSTFVIFFLKNPKKYFARKNFFLHGVPPRKFPKYVLESNSTWGPHSLATYRSVRPSVSGHVFKITPSYSTILWSRQ
jgi:hypothetical protein